MPDFEKLLEENNDQIILEAIENEIKTNGATKEILFKKIMNQSFGKKLEDLFDQVERKLKNQENNLKKNNWLSNIEFNSKMTEKKALTVHCSDVPRISTATKKLLEVFGETIEEINFDRAGFISLKISEQIQIVATSDFPKVFRKKIHCIRNNKKICKQIYEGIIDAKMFVDMTDQDMKTDEKKRKEKIIIDEATNASKKPELKAETDMFVCSKCKQSKTSYRQAQTRSCDEPMTTFVTCSNCGHNWRF